MEKKGLLFLLLLYLVVLILLVYRYYESFEPKRYRSIIDPPRLVNHVPVGELAGDIVVEQDLYLNTEIVDELRKFDNEPFCIGLMFATYGDRDNKGKIRVALKKSDEIASAFVDFSRLHDNSSKWICFDNLEARSLKEGLYKLTITGVNGRSGQSVTLWLTDDNRYGEAFFNGESTAKSLLLKIGVMREDIYYSVAMWTLLVTNLMVFLLLMWFYRVSDESGA